MRESPAVGRLAADVTGHAGFRGIVALLEGDSVPLGFGTHRFEFEDSPQRSVATFVDHASRPTDLGVGKRRGVLLQKIDEATLSLQQPEELQRGRQISFDFGHIHPGHRLGRELGLSRCGRVESSNPSREVRIEQNTPRKDEREPETARKGKPGEAWGFRPWGA